MYLYLTIIVVVVGIISLVGTLLIGKKVDKTTEEYKKEANRTEAQLKRSNEYETQSLKLNVKVLTLIYVFTFLFSIIALAVYIYLK
ncbi:hypothetical protein [Pseudalkalibacillus berkeleyi]|uniref:DUF3899 domain-containing protein n=1 Tax=Pseudalkalibacillus berkeleyi TaxID=1069813 RepID=A0ABS9GUY5_9BACL|nr:hypothetical protein [Pseudalkalibacillus berkeleyi]MCF6136654.1 hypothetical protein [Pseudalkalibacillus berkeleyi]